MRLTVMLMKCKELFKQVKSTMRVTLKKMIPRKVRRRLKTSSKKGRKIYLMISRAVRMKRWRLKKNLREQRISLERAPWGTKLRKKRKSERKRLKWEARMEFSLRRSTILKGCWSQTKINLTCGSSIWHLCLRSLMLKLQGESLRELSNLSQLLQRQTSLTYGLRIWTSRISSDLSSSSRPSSKGQLR